jgi:hypothetical protein
MDESGFWVAGYLIRMVDDNKTKRPVRTTDITRTDGQSADDGGKTYLTIVRFGVATTQRTMLALFVILKDWQCLFAQPVSLGSQATHFGPVDPRFPFTGDSLFPALEFRCRSGLIMSRWSPTFMAIYDL